MIILVWVKYRFVSELMACTIFLKSALQRAKTAFSKFSEVLKLKNWRPTSGCMCFEKVLM